MYLEKELGKFVTSLIDESLASYQKEKGVIRQFKSTLKETVDSLDADKFKLPVVVIVDELDRCRPSSAVELVEVVKHLFSVDGVVFVLGLNTTQLAHSVSALYGSKFDGRTYLNRFIDLDLTLPVAERSELVKAKLESLNIASDADLIPLASLQPQLHASAHEMLSTFFDLVEMDYRAVIHSLGRLALVMGAVGSAQELKTLICLVLHILRSLDQDLYRRFRHSEADDEYIIRQVFSGQGGKELIQTDVGSLFAMVIVALSAMLRNHLHDLEDNSAVYLRIFSKHLAIHNRDSPELQLKEADELLDLMNSEKCLNTVGSIRSQLWEEQSNFKSIFNLIDLIETTTQ